MDDKLTIPPRTDTLERFKWYEISTGEEPRPVMQFCGVDGQGNECFAQYDDIYNTHRHGVHFRGPYFGPVDAPDDEYACCITEHDEFTTYPNTHGIEIWDSRKFRPHHGPADEHPSRWLHDDPWESTYVREIRKVMRAL